MTDLGAERRAWERRRAERQLTDRARAALSRAGWNAARQALEEAAAERWPEEAALIAVRAVELQEGEQAQVRHLDPETTAVRPHEEGLTIEDLERKARRSPGRQREEGEPVTPMGKPAKQLDAIREQIRKVLKAEPKLTAREAQEKVPAAAAMTAGAFSAHVTIARKRLGIAAPHRGGRREKATTPPQAPSAKPTEPVAKVPPRPAKTVDPTPAPPAANGPRPAPDPPPAPPRTEPVEVHSRDLHLVASRQGNRIAIVLNATLPVYTAQELIKMVTRDALTP